MPYQSATVVFPKMGIAAGESASVLLGVNCPELVLRKLDDWLFSASTIPSSCCWLLQVDGNGDISVGLLFGFVVQVMVMQSKKGR